MRRIHLTPIYTLKATTSDNTRAAFANAIIIASTPVGRPFAPLTKGLWHGGPIRGQGFSKNIGARIHLRFGQKQALMVQLCTNRVAQESSPSPRGGEGCRGPAECLCSGLLKLFNILIEAHTPYAYLYTRKP